MERDLHTLKQAIRAILKMSELEPVLARHKVTGEERLALIAKVKGIASGPYGVATPIAFVQPDAGKAQEWEYEGMVSAVGPLDAAEIARLGKQAVMQMIAHADTPDSEKGSPALNFPDAVHERFIQDELVNLCTR